MPSYTSFSWSLGTTSFRTKEFNKKIEEQLEALVGFWEIPENQSQRWSRNNALQTRYYDFLKEKLFVTEEAPNKPKDARQKTSGLADIGLADRERKLTQAGLALLRIAQAQAFDSDNQLRIANDSYIYLKQLCKATVDIDGHIVRPYLIAAYILSKVGALSNEEFTFLLPLITNENKLIRIVAELQDVRNSTRSVDDIIFGILMDMSNYQEALEIFSSKPITQELFVEIGLNRKSGDSSSSENKNYDKNYFPIYNNLKQIIFDNSENAVECLYDSISKLSVKPKSYWRKALFNTSNKAKIKREKLSTLNLTARIFTVQSEVEFKREFFRLLHLNKAKSNLSEYFDLNRRYFKTTDTILFRDGMVDFDIVPKCYFNLIADNILSVAFSNTDKLFLNCGFDEIIPNSTVSDDALFAEIARVYGIQVSNVYDVRQFVEDEKVGRFNALIDQRFTKEVLIDLLRKFETRSRENDEAIQNAVTSNADIPTIFEYILGITWYNISERRVNIFNSLNLSLDADLLPKSHAVGGTADMTFKYEATTTYPRHAMLLEATLTERTNQRRAEMESVSRHLGSYMLRQDMSAYCVFISTHLDPNVISDFRGRKLIPFYDTTDTTRFIESMKIIPCQTSELQTILDKDLTYSDLYTLFETAFNSTEAPNVWYGNNIIDKVNDF